jgi:predicted TIM-barrel fold metal-dependent hydrolase
VPRPENNLTVDEIVAAYAYAGVDQVLATHADAKEYDPQIGNEELSGLCADQPLFQPCYVVQPQWTGEMPGGDALVAYLRDGGARGVRLFPKEHSYGLGERWCGPLFSTLAEAGIPLFIDLDQTSWPEIDGILTAHPQLNLVVLRAGYRSDRWVYPLLEAHQGLKLESSNYLPHLGIEVLTERFGPDRLVFGTGMPLWDIGAAISHVMYAAISEEARMQIASASLQSILWQGGAA